MIFMKKLIAIAVVFVLAVGVAFAADVAASVQGGVVPLKGSSEDGSDVTAGGAFGQVRLQASGANEDGNFGGWVRFQKDWGAASFSADYDDFTGTNPEDIKFDLKAVGAWGAVWWKPLDILKVQFGINPDGEYAKDGVTGWNFYQTAGDVGVVKQVWNDGEHGFGASFGGGEDRPGAWLTLTPIEPMEINLSIPFIAMNDELAKNVYKMLRGQISYKISDIGLVAISYRGDLNEITAGASKLFGFFQLTAVENLDLHLGVGYYLPVRDDDLDITVSKPVSLGLCVDFTTGALGIKARVQGQFGGNVKAAGATIKDATVFTGEIQPSFGINDKVSAYLATGLTMTKAEDVDAVVAWHINPYISVSGGLWAPSFYAGVRFDSNGIKDPTTNNTTVYWSIPIGMFFTF
jgi:opacity protein-like surface antigen